MMAEFELVTNSYDFISRTNLFWEKFGPAAVTRVPDNTPLPIMPFLAALHTVGMKDNRTENISYRVAKMICTKKDAKRIIYPRTNGLRRFSYSYTWFKDDVENKVGRFVRNTLRNTKVDPLSPVQARYTEEAMAEAKNTNGPILITYYKYTLPEESIKFFIVNKHEASKLVYYGKENIQKQIAQQSMNSQLYGFENLEPYSVDVSNQFIVKVKLPASFDDQNHVPRFLLEADDHIEYDIRRWERKSIYAINNRINNSGLSVHLAVSLANRITKEFFVIRRRRRLAKLLDYMPNCTNTYTVLSHPLMKSMLEDIQKNRQLIAHT